MATTTTPPSLVTRPHEIGGRSVASSDAEAIDVLDPATGEAIGRIPAGTEIDAQRAVEAARAVRAGWARTAAAERGEALRAAAGRLRARLEDIAGLQTAENGKPLADSRAGVLAGAGTLEQYAQLGPVHRGRSLLGAWEATDLMVPEPFGVAALLVPWNDPVAIACGVIGAALVTGNTVVFKPSEKTPLSGLALAELFELPPGVLNVLLGDARVGRPLVAHPDVDVVCHTGSVATGREVAGVCARRLSKAVLELGGKDPLVIDADVDPEWAAEQAASGAFANAGQICASVERIYVHRSIAEPFVGALVGCAQQLRLGDGRDPGTAMGPLIDERQRAIVHRQVREAQATGARVLAGGVWPSSAGFFYPPTVVVDVRDEDELMREETFGPVAAVRVVDSFEHGLRLADEGTYGLSATVLTHSPANAQRAWRELSAGTVKVNAVWGGAPGGAAQPRRSSGLGHGYGPELLDELTQTKVVHLGLAPGPSPPAPPPHPA